MDKIIKNYIPFNAEEEKDKALILDFIRTGLPLFGRENYAHFTVSAIVLNRTRDQFLLSTTTYMTVGAGWEDTLMEILILKK